jgi:hypothetical protein
LHNFFNFQSRKIEHYNSSKNWFKLERLIEIELSLQRDKRNDVNRFFDLILQELERIHNNQPNIRTDVINKFLKKYKKKSINLDLPEIIKLRKITVVSNINRGSSNPEQGRGLTPSRNTGNNNISDIKTNLSKSNFTPVINNEIDSEESSGNGLNIII